MSSVVLSGGTVVFPTDTVYGLGSNPRSEIGVAKCFELKGRDSNKPMPVLFSGIEEVEKVVLLDRISLSLAMGFWPGSLTMILPLRKGVSIPKRLVGSNNSLAVRIPNHECCKELIVACGGSLIGTSANISGLLPFVNCDDPDLLKFANGADYLVKGSCGLSKSSSTIVDLTSKEGIRFSREGAISKIEVLSYLEKTSRTDFSSSKSRT